MTVDTNAWELAVLVSSTAGFIAQLIILRKVQRTFGALRGITNGRRRIAWFHATTVLALLYTHAVLMYYSIRLTNTPDPPTPWPLELKINFGLFVGLSAALVLVGLNDLRVRHAVRKEH